YRVADAFVKFEAHTGVDGVFFFLAAAAQRGERDAELLAFSCGDVARGFGGYSDNETRRRQPRWVVHNTRIAVLQCDSLLEFFLGLAGGDHGFGETAAFVDGFGALAEVKHPGGELDAEIAKIRWTAAAEDFDRLDDFARM